MSAPRKGLGFALGQELVARFEDALDRGDKVDAKRWLDQLAAHTSLDPRDLLHAQAQWTWETVGPQQAIEDYRNLVHIDPEDADAWHALGTLYGELDQHELCRDSFLRVLEIDQRQTTGLDEPWRENLVIDRVRRLMGRLPPDLASRVDTLPIVLERWPSRELVEQGFDPRALGLFEGADLAARHEAHAFATRIVLFMANLQATFPAMPALLRQVEITVLHELGHYLGLDEEQVDALGLG